MTISTNLISEWDLVTVFTKSYNNSFFSVSDIFIVLKPLLKQDFRLFMSELYVFHWRVHMLVAKKQMLGKHITVNTLMYCPIVSDKSYYLPRLKLKHHFPRITLGFCYSALLRTWNAVFGCNLKKMTEWSLLISKANHSISQQSKSMAQPVMLKKLMLNGSMKTYKAF